jgi:tyrosyl-tRNA synthetase
MDKQKIVEDILNRGVANIIPGKKELQEALTSGKKLNIYLGIDPTATRIHLGNAVPLRKLQKFVDLGHNVTFLIGDFTALIGDTSDKESERPSLNLKQIKKNFITYKKQAKKILNFDKVSLKHNSSWLSKLSFEEIVKLAQNFSVGDFVGRELITKRLKQNKRVGLHELLYPIMQGYDSYYMDTDIQLGGTDQTFNMQAGRTLQKKLNNKESFIIANEFLDGTDGRKMSKTWNNGIWLEDKPNNMYGKVMSLRDDLIIQYFTLATQTPLSQIKVIGESLKDKSVNPMDIKKKLAHTIVSELHSIKEADEAQKEFENVHQKGNLPQDMIEFPIKTDTLISEIALNTKSVTSTSEIKRLIYQGGVSLNNQKVTDFNTLVKPGSIIKIGKRHFIKT